MKWLVEKLARADRRFVDRYLIDHEYRGYDALVELLRHRGIDIGVSSLKRYGRRMRSEREEARMIASTTTAALLARSKRKGIASS